MTTHCSNPATGDQLVHLFRGCGALKCCANHGVTVRIPTYSAPSTASGATGPGIFTTTSSQTPPCSLDETSSRTWYPVSSTDDKSSSYSTNTTSFSTDLQQEGTTAHSVYMLNAVTWSSHMIDYLCTIQYSWWIHGFALNPHLYITRGMRSCDPRINSS